VKRRAALRAAGLRGLALFPGNHDSPMNYRDNAYPFRQDSCFLYFFGLDQPALAGLIDLDSGEEWLYGTDISLDDVVWTGPLPTLAERAARAGVQRTAAPAALAAKLGEALDAGREVHHLRPYRADTLADLARWLRVPLDAAAAGHSLPLTVAVVALRERKAPEEIAEIEAALAVTAEMHHAAMRAARPGVLEREVVGLMEGIARRHDWQLAYPSIFSKRGEVLHNHGHGLTLERGDLVVNDTGVASGGGYASDITRTIPVGGRLAGVQRELYELVLDAQQRVIARLAPGVPFAEMHELAARTMAEGLRALGCLHGDPAEIVASGAYAVFFQCGLGHQLGLDVHDMEALGEDHVGYGGGHVRSPLFGRRYLRLAKPVQPGMVVTVEPGIYFIPALLDQWGAQRRHAQFIDYAALERFRDAGGIRIEDDVLITDTGCRVLGPHIARTADEVEAAMAD
jgi:Xaa-Pro aminopeptidase/Xaa-Pro dipeptidase